MTTGTKNTVAEGSTGQEASKTDMAKTLANNLRELEALQTYTKALADQLKTADAKTLADQERAWKALMENGKTLREQLNALAAAKLDTKMPTDEVTAWKALHDYTKTPGEPAKALEAPKPGTGKTISDYARAWARVRRLGAVGRNAKAFGEGFTSALSPSFYLWLESGDYERSYSIKHSSLREIWEQVGQHINEASFVVTLKHGRRQEP